jgi:hypothetical protein
VLNVMHVDMNRELGWIDSAGYLVARGAKPRDWPADPSQFHYQLDVAGAHVNVSLYLPHL